MKDRNSKKGVREIRKGEGERSSEVGQRPRGDASRESTDDSQRDSFRFPFIPETCGLMVSLADGNACNFYNAHASRSSAPLEILKGFLRPARERHADAKHPSSSKVSYASSIFIRRSTFRRFCFYQMTISASARNLC